MKKSYLLGAVCACLSSLVLPISVNAALLDFEGMNNSVTTYSADGYNFEFSFSGWFIGQYVSYNNNGTTVLNGQGAYSVTGLGNYVDISLTNGSTFDVSMFDASIMHNSFSSGSLFVTGLLSGGGTVTETVSLSNTYNTYSLPSAFTDLTSIRFGEMGGSPDWLGSAGISIDNIQFSTVPIPPALWLFGSGLLVLIGLTRRRKAVTPQF